MLTKLRAESSGELPSTSFFDVGAILVRPPHEKAVEKQQDDQKKKANSEDKFQGRGDEKNRLDQKQDNHQDQDNHHDHDQDQDQNVHYPPSLSNKLSLALAFALSLSFNAYQGYQLHGQNQHVKTQEMQIQTLQTHVSNLEFENIIQSRATILVQDQRHHIQDQETQIQTLQTRVRNLEFDNSIQSCDQSSTTIDWDTCYFQLKASARLGECSENIAKNFHDLYQRGFHGAQTILGGGTGDDTEDGRTNKTEDPGSDDMESVLRDWAETFPSVFVQPMDTIQSLFEGLKTGMESVARGGNSGNDDEEDVIGSAFKGWTESVQSFFEEADRDKDVVGKVYKEFVASFASMADDQNTSAFAGIFDE
eukprot:CAMPEP_0197256930 /NCGR_PEP_ID=MMETSP1429-20130617/77039_1 /TAXON_ID=49237 /ORGANISM="Chaetoceros  sp., Strain UNC1202" /LENGTH=363 /DNA_ID=CAMNT_0042720641 /DNA_START=58 /DNA_END=1149 /DNA_ORIENTATION=-